MVLDETVTQLDQYRFYQHLAIFGKKVSNTPNYDLSKRSKYS